MGALGGMSRGSGVPGLPGVPAVSVGSGLRGVFGSGPGCPLLPGTGACALVFPGPGACAGFWPGGACVGAWTWRAVGPWAVGLGAPRASSRGAGGGVPARVLALGHRAGGPGVQVRARGPSIPHVRVRGLAGAGPTWVLGRVPGGPGEGSGEASRGSWEAPGGQTDPPSMLLRGGCVGPGAGGFRGGLPADLDAPHSCFRRSEAFHLGKRGAGKVTSR